jgi:DNA repair protein RecN (Recombination protein N)
LSIRDFILIDHLDFELEPGLNVLTGETGAGKSIVLDALGFVLGGRSDREVVRLGAKNASVTAEFAPPGKHPARVALADNGFDAEGPILLRRQLSSDGRSKAYLNDQPVSAGFLRSIAEQLIEIHGQHDDRGLLNPAAHRALVDAHGGITPMAAAVALAFEGWQSAAARVREAEAAAASADREQDFLRHAVAELSELNASPNEEGALAIERSSLMAAEKVSGDLADAVDALTENNGIEARMNLALRRLARVQGSAGGKLDASIAALERAIIEAGDARSALELAARTFGADPNRLEIVETRLFAVRAAARKYGVTCDGLVSKLHGFAAALASIETSARTLAGLQTQAQEARAAYFRLAGELSRARAKAAKRLDEAVAKELAPLKLDKAEFKTALETLDESQSGPGGVDRIWFSISTNPGAPFGPLSKIASGGELSRFILALKVALAEQGTATTLIFDEVDQGVGGAVADAVGERLLRLSQDAQVLVVTHAPQVAARGQHHWRVTKAMQGAAMTTQVSALSGEERLEEIARMLSGAKVTAEARAAARALFVSPDKAPARRRGNA